MNRGIPDTLENEENDYKRQVKKFHEKMKDIKMKKETLAHNERENQQTRDVYEANKENWEAELKKKEGQRKEARVKFKKAEDTLRLRIGKFIEPIIDNQLLPILVYKLH